MFTIKRLLEFVFLSVFGLFSVKSFPYGNFFPSLRSSPLVRIPQGIHASAIFLLVKLFPFRDLDHSLGTSRLPPVVGPVNEVLIAGRRPLSATIYLDHVFPAGNPQTARKDRKIIFMGVERRSLETHVEAFRATSAPFRFPLQSLYPLKPIANVVIDIHVLDPQLVAKLLVFGLPEFVFALGVNIGVVKKDGRLNGRFQQRLQNLALAGSAARME